MSAVPLLSIISGFLFFKRDHVHVLMLIKGRVRTVLYPSLIWTSFWLAFGFTLYSVGKPYGLFGWLDYDFEHFTFLTLVSGIVGLKDYPLAYQFWFIHDLVLTLLLTPIIHFFLQRFDLPMLFVVLFLWFAGIVPPLFFYGNVLCFFIVGAVIARANIDLFELAKQSYDRLGLIFILFSFVVVMQIFASNLEWFETGLWLRILRLLGVLTASGCMYFFMTQYPAAVTKINVYSGSSFLIFALHYPLIEFVKIVVLRAPYLTTSTGLIISLFLIPITTILLSYGSGLMLHKLSPRVARVLSGGR